jgi:hypothetical protein
MRCPGLVAQASTTCKTGCARGAAAGRLSPTLMLPARAEPARVCVSAWTRRGRCRGPMVSKVTGCVFTTRSVPGHLRSTRGIATTARRWRLEDRTISAWRRGTRTRSWPRCQPPTGQFGLHRRVQEPDANPSAALSRALHMQGVQEFGRHHATPVNSILPCGSR